MKEKMNRTKKHPLYLSMWLGYIKKQRCDILGFTKISCSTIYKAVYCEKDLDLSLVFI